MWVKTFIIHLFYFFRSSYFHDSHFLIYTLGKYEFSIHLGEHDRHHLTLFASEVQRCFSLTTIRDSVSYSEDSVQSAVRIRFKRKVHPPEGA